MEPSVILYNKAKRTDKNILIFVTFYFFLLKTQLFVRYLWTPKTWRQKFWYQQHHFPTIRVSEKREINEVWKKSLICKIHKKFEKKTSKYLGNQLRKEKIGFNRWTLIRMTENLSLPKILQQNRTTRQGTNSQKHRVEC